MAELTLQVKVRCEACNGQGLIRRGRYIDDSHKPYPQHVVDEFDCEQCGGTGHTMQTVTLDEAAIKQITEAVMRQMPKTTRLATGTRIF